MIVHLALWEKWSNIWGWSSICHSQISCNILAIRSVWANEKLWSLSGFIILTPLCVKRNPYRPLLKDLIDAIPSGHSSGWDITSDQSIVAAWNNYNNMVKDKFWEHLEPHNAKILSCWSCLNSLRRLILQKGNLLQIQTMGLFKTMHDQWHICQMAKEAWWWYHEVHNGCTFYWWKQHKTNDKINSMFPLTPKSIMKLGLS